MIIVYCWAQYFLCNEFYCCWGWFFYVNLYLGVSPRWFGFPGNQDDPSFSYSPGDLVTTVVAKRVFTEIGSFRMDRLGDPFI